MEGNPCVIQSPSATGNTRTPLVLIHDAGGTVLQYFRLGVLDRPVYGITNPRLDQGGRWDHGLRQMGVVYTHLVRSVIPSGDILLGGMPRKLLLLMIYINSSNLCLGWSLGGFLALEVASRLKQLPQYTVRGIILIDSVFPTESVKAGYPRTLAEVASGFQLPAQMTDEGRRLAEQCFLSAHDMHRDWQPPDSPSGNPPAVLIRAVGRIHKGTDCEPHYFDTVRTWKNLGWEDYDTSFIKACLEASGNHFTVFEEPNVRVSFATLLLCFLECVTDTGRQIEQTTRQVREACLLLTEMQR
jgi:thioesterase domain-containing protein